jgi:hypothetical protein
MVRLVIALLLSLIAAAALARPSTLAMSCGQARALVAAQGAVVMSTGTYAFDRYVATPGLCMLGEYAYYGYGPTQDARSCRIGFVCKPHSPFFNAADRS